MSSWPVGWQNRVAGVLAEYPTAPAKCQILAESSLQLNKDWSSEEQKTIIK